MKILLHLLKTDWQRFKRPLVALWLLLTMSALPWVLDSPNDYAMPFRFGASYHGDFKDLPGDFTSGTWTGPASIFLQIVATLLALVLASMLGAQSARQRITPIRHRERLAALALALLCFMVLPQWLLAAGNLLLRGFDPVTAVLAAGAPAVTTWLLLGFAAAFAVWLPSTWVLLAGWAALVTAVGVASEIYRPLDYMVRGFPSLPMLPAGRREWVFGVVVIALLAVGFKIIGRRLSGPWKIVVAVALILAAGVPAIWLPNPDVRVPQDREVSTNAVRPTISRVQLRAKHQPGTNSVALFDVTADLGATGIPAGHGVQWEFHRGWISQGGNRLAAVLPRRDSYSSAQDEVGYFMPDYRAAGVEQAAAAALPGGGGGTGFFDDNRSTSAALLGECHLPQDVSLSPQREAQLTMDFTGTVFRYEKVWDVPLNSEPTRIQTDKLTWWTRLRTDKRGEPLADVMVIHPAFGISTDPDAVRWDASPLDPLRLYFYFPASGAIARAEDEQLRAAGPLFSGAGWHREILGRQSPHGKTPDLTGARLILLRPVPVARITTSVVGTFRPWATNDTSDFAVMHRYRINPVIYRREYFPSRPDPRTCSREEFARWLRIPASMFLDGSGAERDLATYAPRFAGLMAKVGNHYTVAEALELGTPESMRDGVIGKIDLLENPDRLASVAFGRGWLGEARESILRRFREGGMSQTAAVMALEDPTTYPELIRRLLSDPRRETYEQLRMLPGVEPLLGDEIAKAAQATPAAALAQDLNSFQYSSPYKAHLYAAKRGNADSLQIILQVFQAGGDKVEFAPFRDLSYILKVPELPGGAGKSLVGWLSGKSASSFRFDPLVRLWIPLP